MAENFNLIKYMNEFDSSEPIAADFNEKKFEAISKRLDSHDREEREDALSQIPSKVKNLVKIVSKTVEKLNATLSSKFPNMRPLDLEKSVTFNASGASGKFEIIEAGNDQHISFNVKKLSTYPSMEVVSIVTKSVTDAIAKQNGRENDKEFYNTILLYNPDGSEPKSKEEKDVLKAKNIIAGYLRNFLPAVYADDFEKFVAISDYVAKQIIAEMGEKDIEKILSPFFDLETLGVEEIAMDKVDAFLGKTYDARVTKIRKTADELLANPQTEVQAFSYLDQANSLMGTNMLDPSYLELAKKFETMNNGERCLSGPAVKEFCMFYVQDFLAKRNVANIEVTFESKGGLGSFYDEGHKININLEKLKKKGSYTELAMTLAHELTHTVDSTKEKLQGHDGLQNDISEKFRNKTDDADVKTFMNKLLRISYRVNPNERNARRGEVYALMFMTKMSAKDSSLVGDIKNSARTFKMRQRSVINLIKSMPQELAEIKGELADFVASNAIEKGSPLHKEILERIEYIEEFGLNASVAEDEKAIEIVDMILNGEGGLTQIQQQEQRTAAERAAKIKANEEANKEAAEEIMQL